MPRPDFLIIGAMKSGTTSLYRDLLTNPAVFMPIDKEPNALCDDRVLSDAGRADYERLFARARPDQICGEASTSYTKAPDSSGVPKRAREVLGPDVRLIYLVREPVARIISHHHHDHTAGEIATPDINEALQRYPQLINWSRYAMQAGNWLEHFDRNNLCIMRFEDYVADRRSAVERLSRFLGIEPRLDRIDMEAVYNRSAGKPVARGPMRRFIDGAFYRRLIRPFLPASTKDRLRAALLPRATRQLAPPTPESVAWIIDQLREDMEELRRIMGSEAPVWDLDAAGARAGVSATRSSTSHPAAGTAGAP